MRTDIIEVYVFQQRSRAVLDSRGAWDLQFLQLLRAEDSKTAADTWQPVMGHVKEGELAVEAALRELEEETDITKANFEGFWQLEQPNVYFLHQQNCMMLAPCFAAKLSKHFSPNHIKLNREHKAFRWVNENQIDKHFFWAGQRAVVKQIAQEIAGAGSPMAPFLRIDL